MVRPLSACAHAAPAIALPPRVHAVPAAAPPLRQRASAWGHLAWAPGTCACGQRRLVATCASNPFKEAQRDVLPGGVPNTPGRRLSYAISHAISLGDLSRLLAANRHKAAQGVWRHKHEAAVLMRTASLVYYKALAGERDPQLISDLEMLLRQSAEVAASQPDAIRQLEGAKARQLLAACALMGATMPRSLSEAILTELLRDSAKKIPSNSAPKMAELVWSLAVLRAGFRRDPTAAAAAAAGQQPQQQLGGATAPVGSTALGQGRTQAPGQQRQRAAVGTSGAEAKPAQFGVAATGRQQGQQGSTAAGPGPGHAEWEADGSGRPLLWLELQRCALLALQPLQQRQKPATGQQQRRRPTSRLSGQGQQRGRDDGPLAGTDTAAAAAAARAVSAASPLQQKLRAMSALSASSSSTSSSHSRLTFTGLSKLAWGFTVAGCHSKALFATIEDVAVGIRGGVPDQDPRAVANLAYAFAKAGQPCPRLLPLLCQAFASAMRESFGIGAVEAPAALGPGTSFAALLPPPTDMQQQRQHQQQRGQGAADKNGSLLQPASPSVASTDAESLEASGEACASSNGTSQDVQLVPDRPSDRGGTTDPSLALMVSTAFTSASALVVGRSLQRHGSEGGAAFGAAVEAPHVAKMAWATAALRHRDEALLGLVAEVLPRASLRFTADEVSHIAWALTTLQYDSPAAYHSLARRFVSQRMYGVSNAQLCTLALAYSSAGPDASAAATPPLPTAFPTLSCGSASAAECTGISNAQLCMLASAYSSASPAAGAAAAPSAFFATIGRLAAGRLNSLATQELVSLACSLAAVGHQNEFLMEAATNAALRDLPSLGASWVADLVAALSTTGHHKARSRLMSAVLSQGRPSTAPHLPATFSFDGSSADLSSASEGVLGRVWSKRERVGRGGDDGGAGDSERRRPRAGAKAAAAAAIAGWGG